MLLRFSFSNFRSFRDEQEFSMVAAALSELPEIIRCPKAIKEGILPVAAIYGANASGKTNVLKALMFVQQAIDKSQREWRPSGPIPRQAFGLDQESANSSSRFVVDVLIAGTRYQYGFSVTSEAVQEEWLTAYPNGRPQAWYVRRFGAPMKFSSKMTGENKTIETLVRANSLYLSAAAQNNHQTLTPICQWLVHAFKFVTPQASPLWRPPAGALEDNEDVKRIIDLLRPADLGVEGMKIERNHLQGAFAELLREVGEHVDIGENTIQLIHGAGSSRIALPFEQESSGTIAYLSILVPMLKALKFGGVLCVDELDANLHPLLAAQIISAFNKTDSNPKGAQLLFTTQDTNLLSSKVLRRDQVWFTEKRSEGSSTLYPLSDFKPRRGENIENGYLQGRYGAIPFLNSESFLSSFEPVNGKN